MKSTQLRDLRALSNTNMPRGLFHFHYRHPLPPKKTKVTLKKRNTQTVFEQRKRALLKNSSKEPSNPMNRFIWIERRYKQKNKK